MSLESNIPMDVYISKSAASDPNNFTYDMNFLSVQSLSLNSSNYQALRDPDGFSVAIYM